MSWLPAVAALLIGLVSGGRLDGLRRVPYLSMGLIVASYAVQRIGTDALKTADSNVEHGVLTFSVVLVALALLAMVRLPFVWMALAGVVLNLAAMLANGGAMAVTPDRVADAGFVTVQVQGEQRLVGGKSVIHTWDQTGLPWLTDFIPVHVEGYYKFFSIGDCLFALGMGLTIFALVRLDKPAAEPVAMPEAA